MEAAKWLLVATFAVSALALGAIYTETLLVVAALAVGASLCAAFGPRALENRLPVRLLLMAAGVLIVFTAFQAVPFPVAVVRWLSPEAASIWAHALEPLGGAAPRFETFSLDPVATRIEVLKGLIYLSVFVATARIANPKESSNFIQWALISVGLVLAAAALLHPAFGASKVFGVYKPIYVQGRHVAPLLNPNHLAAYLNIAICLSLGATLSRWSSLHRIIAAAAFVVLIAVQIWVASRGGVLAMLLGILLVVCSSYLAGRAANHPPSPLARMLFPAFMAFAGIIAGVLGASNEAADELAQRDMSKLQVAVKALALSTKFPLVGLGRGAFESVFPAYRNGTGYWVFTHPENIVAQWATEWGWGVALTATALLAFALRPANLLARTRPAVGAWAALMVSVVHNLVDFNSEVPAVGVALAACAGLVVGGEGIRNRSGQPFRLPVRSLALAVATLAAGLVVAAGLGHELYDDRTRLRNLAWGNVDVALSDEGTARWNDALSGAIRRHPAEPYLPFVAAIRAARIPGNNPLPWVALTLERSPVYPPAHNLLARVLASSFPAQARLEYRFAAEQGSDDVREALPLVGGFDDAMELVPEGEPGNSVLTQLIAYIPPALPATALRLEEVLERRHPVVQDSLRRLAGRAVSDLAAGDAAPWCSEERSKCLENSIAAVEALKVAVPGRCEPFRFRAQLAVEMNDPAAALSEMARAVDTVADRADCLRSYATMAHQLHEPDRASDAVSRYLKLGCSETSECVGQFLWASSFEGSRGNARTAYTFLKRAADQDSGNLELLRRAAETATSLGLNAEALHWYERLSSAAPGDSRWPAAEAKSRDALDRDAMQRRNAGIERR